MLLGMFALNGSAPAPPAFSWKLDDQGQTWWIRPISARYNGFYYVCGITRAGGYKVSQISEADGSIVDFTLATHEGDDHNSPSITRLPDGRLLAMYTRHGLDSLIRYRISTSADDISAWGSEATISASTQATYTQVWIDSTDRIHLFYRVTTDEWAHRYSDDDAGTWSAEKVWLDTTNRPYIATVPVPGDPDTLRLAIAGHPLDSADHNIYYAEIDLTTGDIASPGGASQVNLYDASPAIEPDVFEVMYDAAASGLNTRMFDIGPGTIPQVLFATFTDTLDAEYREGRRVSGSWAISSAIADAGPPIENPVGGNYYFAGMAAAANPDVLYLARRDWTTANWPVERYAYSGGSWSLSSQVMEGDWRTFKELFRPMVPVDAGSMIPVTVNRGEYEFYGTTAGTNQRSSDVVIDPSAEPAFSETVIYEESFAGLTDGAAMSGYSVLVKSAGITNETFTSLETPDYFGGMYGNFFHSGGSTVLWGRTGSAVQDLVMKADLRIDQSPATSGISGLVARWADSNNRIELFMDFLSTPTLKLRERRLGSNSDSTMAISGVSKGDALTLVLTLDGTAANGKVYRNGILLGELNRTIVRTPAPGAWGFNSGTGTTAGTMVTQIQRLLITEP